MSNKENKKCKEYDLTPTNTLLREYYRNILDNADLSQATMSLSRLYPYVPEDDPDKLYGYIGISPREVIFMLCVNSNAVHQSKFRYTDCYNEYVGSISDLNQAILTIGDHGNAIAAKYHIISPLEKGPMHSETYSQITMLHNAKHNLNELQRHSNVYTVLTNKLAKICDMSLDSLIEQAEEIEQSDTSIILVREFSGSPIDNYGPSEFPDVNVQTLTGFIQNSIVGFIPQSENSEWYMNELFKKEQTIQYKA